jgi:hypothetical protein
MTINPLEGLERGGKPLKCENFYAIGRPNVKAYGALEAL